MAIKIKKSKEKIYLLKNSFGIFFVSIMLEMNAGVQNIMDMMECSSNAVHSSMSPVSKCLKTNIWIRCMLNKRKVK